MKSQSRHAGFTMLELVVTLAIIGVLAAVLTPIVTNYVDQARITRANQEAQTIATGILNFNKDTGKWPIFATGLNITTTTAIYQVLSSPGIFPACNSCSGTWTGTSSDSISNQLEFNKPGGTGSSYGTSGKFAWRGPYVTSVGQDPWGYAYVINAGALAYGTSSFAAFVLSAGPNNTIDTAFLQSIGTGTSAITVGPDDIIARIK